MVSTINYHYHYLQPWHLISLHYVFFVFFVLLVHDKRFVQNVGKPW
uniref:Uncharacterized protein n=1 Tax=Anguilla anguilla TaxID=7936 RepID=A0A0E9VAZ4_ANGAN